MLLQQREAVIIQCVRVCVCDRGLGGWGVNL